MNVDTQQGTSSKGKGKGKGKDKRENQVQADKVPRKTKKKEEEIKMDVWLQLPQELILEIFRFVVASKSNWLHDKCITHCKKSTLASKIALKEQYEKGASIEEYTFFNLEDVLGCPIWGVGHLSQLKVNIELRHCECTLGSDLHTRLNKPSKITIGQLTLIDEGVKLRRYRKMMFGARIVVKDFGNPKYLKAKKKENAESDSEDDTDDDGDVEVCYHDGCLKDAFKNTCGKVTYCNGCFDNWMGLEDVEQYSMIDIEEDRACEKCYEKAAYAKATGECVF